MIRVAHITPFMSIGGVEQMVLDLCRFRDRSTFECIVAAPEDGPIAGEIRQTGTLVYTGEASYYAAMRFADIVNLHCIDHRPDWHELVQSSGKPYIMTLHSEFEMPRLPAITICTSLYAYRVQKHKSRFVAIPNGVDLSRFSPRPKRQRAEVIITRVCRPIRCAPYFWTAMQKVLGRYSQARLWIVGNQDGLGRSSEQISFLGVRRDIPEILAETDIFAYAPYQNTGSKDLVVMEALAMGLPCVVSDSVAVNESVEHGQNGFLVPYGDVDAFAQKLGMLIEDASLRNQMGEAAIRIAQERFDMRHVVQRYEAVYEAVLSAY